MAIRPTRQPYVALLRRSPTTTIPRPSLLIPLLIPIIAIIVFRPHRFADNLRPRSTPPQHFQFPPPLSHHFAHLQRPPATPLPRPPDWRRPRVLTVHARPHWNHHYLLTVFTTGTDAGWFQRRLKLVGCAVGQALYPAHRVFPETVHCKIPQLPHPAAPVTALLAWDTALQSSIDNPDWIAGVAFPILSGDLVPTNNTLDGRRVALIRSDIRWYHQLYDPPRVDQPRYEVCLMTQIKHDAHLLPDWISFYRRLGVDRFYIYDNRAPAPLDAAHTHYTEVVYWPFTRAQSQAFTHFLLAGRTRCKYTAFFDVDEYAFVGGDQARLLKTYMEHRIAQGYAQVLFPQLQMNSNGYVKRPRGPIPELYTRAEKYQRGFGVKPLLVSGKDWHFHRTNEAQGMRVTTYFNGSVSPELKELDDNAIIVHYLSRSWEEFVDKRREGSTAINQAYVPPSVLNASNAQDWYLSQAHSWDMFQFQTFWRRIMRKRDPGEVRMTWNVGNQSCFQDYCPGCLLRSMGTATCEDR